MLPDNLGQSRHIQILCLGSEDHQLHNKIQCWYGGTLALLLSCSHKDDQIDGSVHYGHCPNSHSLSAQTQSGELL